MVFFHLNHNVDLILIKKNDKFSQLAVSYRYDIGSTRYAYRAHWEIDMPLFNLAKAFPNTPISK